MADARRRRRPVVDELLVTRLDHTASPMQAARLRSSSVIARSMFQDRDVKERLTLGDIVNDGGKGGGAQNTHKYIVIQAVCKFNLQMHSADHVGPPNNRSRSGLASNTTLGLTILAIVSGFDYLNRNLAEILLALELANRIRYTTVSPT
jgi:hypothetical protein